LWALPGHNTRGKLYSRELKDCGVEGGNCWKDKGEEKYKKANGQVTGTKDHPKKRKHGGKELQGRETGGTKSKTIVGGRRGRGGGGVSGRRGGGEFSKTLGKKEERGRTAIRTRRATVVG